MVQSSRSFVPVTVDGASALHSYFCVCDLLAGFVMLFTTSDALPFADRLHLLARFLLLSFSGKLDANRVSISHPLAT